MTGEKIKEVAMAFNLVKQAAENSPGTLQYHQQLQNALNTVATFIQEVALEVQETMNQSDSEKSTKK
jgi:hypothetical protein